MKCFWIHGEEGLSLFCAPSELPTAMRPCSQLWLVSRAAPSLDCELLEGRTYVYSLLSFHMAKHRALHISGT